MGIYHWKEQENKSFRVAAFGSSNTQLSFANAGRHNWVDWLHMNLQHTIGTHVTVTNLGIGGDKADDLLNRMERDVMPLNPSLVIVTIGGNDAAQEVPVIRFADNLKRICLNIREYQAIPVLQTYYCPVYHESPSGFQKRFEDMMQVERDLASEEGLELVDQLSCFEPLYRNDPATYTKLMRDWLHLNHLGNFVMGQFISTHYGMPALPIPEDLQPDLVPILAKLAL